ncbi:MurR/RpiR family transcriptional regulator [Ensifer adhaerens]|uniref:MurR/RpiR family transcriptional regulator n=1 Tax=Ensifer adhaerens TaxID=106592 RepID=UPI0020303758|nr:MurR/RpiR family transcriptional regulator [Ensifer adhaerens]
MTVREILSQPDLSLTPSEERIIQVLLAEYPIAGLGTANSLAKKAGVSDPTVTRLVVKLGFEGFPDFQAKLISDVETRLQSPLQMMESKKSQVGDEGPVVTYLRSVSNLVEKTIGATPVTTYDRAAKLLMDARQVVVLGGRFSRHVAGMLGSYILQFRSNVRDADTLSAQEFDTLVDMGRKDVLVVFDYRRYQRDVVEYSTQAAANGVKIVLFTDQWLSPIAEVAEVTIIAPQDVASPYDTLVPSLAQMEALVASMVANMTSEMRGRIEKLESIRGANGVTIDSVREERASQQDAKQFLRSPTNGRKSGSTTHGGKVTRNA